MDRFKHVHEDYLERGFSRKVGFGKQPCILVVDLNKGFTDPNSSVGADLTEVIYETNKLLKVAREKDVKVIFTTIAYNRKEEAGLWLKKIPALEELVIGNGNEEIDERLEQRPEERVIVKKFGSCFYGTTLIHELISEGIDTLILSGTSTSGCIRATAIDALQNGFHAIVAKEAVGDRSDEPHQANLFDIDAKYGDVLDIDEVLAYLKGL